ncbi:uncharacterized protein BX663DRAFT_498591 [Cokeromyces recurvatus]|uniref:uncharacterized protein n=1 Tax=Cokeromyces recurvatus TaxID=90255 RepID=UPI0022201066|nr:uncharacterized protein BX663DRAFT_498591 [Cokeromyces recurvatus]KAI7906046.1 hypothetical protein BX663DRAFT_498591 [Cokeromyces recurvatus]
MVVILMDVIGLLSILLLNDILSFFFLFLWTQDDSSWIQTKSFYHSPVYVDIQQMVLMCNSISYSIARRRI